MTCSRLQCFAILHHRLKSIRDNSSSKFIMFWFWSKHGRYRHKVYTEIIVDIKHFSCLIVSLLCTRMSSMSFLPEKLCASEKESCSHFSSDDISPLIDQQRQITIRMDPVFITVPNNGF